MQACVIGLGKVGLPLAVQYASKGLPVIGVDVDPHLVEQVNGGYCSLSWEDGLQEKLRWAHHRGLLKATTDVAEGVRLSDVVVVIVPVGLTEDRRAQLVPLYTTADAISKGLHPGQLVIVETTVPVGTSRRFGQLLAEGSELVMGRDFHVAFSPERVGSGQILHDLNAYPKLVGGVDDLSARMAADFYRRVLDTPVLILRDAETAEFTKLAELTYRDVNIALANELAKAAHRAGVDIQEIIEAANSEPLSHIHRPGLGVGGHCVPVNPYFLINELGPMPLAQLAREVNDGMAEFVKELLKEALGGLAQRTVLILGLGYRPNVKEAANSPARRLYDLLQAAGARVLIHDPEFSPEEIGSMGLTPVSLEEPLPVDAVILQVLHSEYRSLNMALFEGCSLLLDGRNALRREEVEAAGMRYIGVGRGEKRLSALVRT